MFGAFYTGECCIIREQSTVSGAFGNTTFKGWCVQNRLGIARGRLCPGIYERREFQSKRVRCFNGWGYQVKSKGSSASEFGNVKVISEFPVKYYWFSTYSMEWKVGSWM